MVTESGWFTEVWKAITGAPAVTIHHSETTET